MNYSLDSSLLAAHSENTKLKAMMGQPLHYRHHILLKLFLGFYKGALSAQVSASCEYQPTCSTFSWLALDEFGLCKALFLTADRLTRCNGNSRSETSPYLIRTEDAKILDFPYQYKFTK